MKHTIHISLIILVFMTSCFKKEDPLILPIGSSEITTLSMGKDYLKEVYFDLGTNTYQEKALIDWDIKFQTGSNEFGVFLNNGTNVILYKLNYHSLDEPSTLDTTANVLTKELVDAPEGDIEHSAFGDWKTYKSLGMPKKSGVYTLQLPYNSGRGRYKRVQIIGVNDSQYFVTFTDLYDAANNPITSGDTIAIPKDKSRNYTYYSFRNGGSGHLVQNAEPEKNTWDFVFTRYKHWFYGILPGNDPFPYIVTGVISNPYNVLIAKDSTSGFTEINYNSISLYTFSDANNAIGYDWKSHSFAAAGTYTVNSKITYIIKDTENQYFKLHFLDFINSKGENGYPKFEFSRLK